MPEALSDLAAIRELWEKHKAFSSPDGRTPPYCMWCQRLAPCDVDRALTLAAQLARAHECQTGCGERIARAIEGEK